MEKPAITGRSRGVDLAKGFLFPLGPLLLSLPIPMGNRLRIVSFGLWGVYLFVIREWSIPSAVRFAYSGRWTRWMLWPYSQGTEESCIAILRSISWGWLAIGIVMMILALVATG